jgi:hypothetical protein
LLVVPLDAVILTDVSVATWLVDTANGALDPFAAMKTDAGTVAATPLLVSMMVTPAAGAGLESLTVPLVGVPPMTLAASRLTSSISPVVVGSLTFVRHAGMLTTASAKMMKMMVIGRTPIGLRK